MHRANASVAQHLNFSKLTNRAKTCGFCIALLNITINIEGVEDSVGSSGWNNKFIKWQCQLIGRFCRGVGN